MGSRHSRAIPPWSWLPSCPQSPDRHRYRHEHIFARTDKKAKAFLSVRASQPGGCLLLIAHLLAEEAQSVEPGGGSCRPLVPKKKARYCGPFCLVPEAGLEPARVLPQRILNPSCLPISPLWHCSVAVGPASACRWKRLGGRVAHYSGGAWGVNRIWRGQGFRVLFAPLRNHLN